MGQNNPVNRFEHIHKMAQETMVMLNHSVEAYVERNEKKAREVIEQDDIVDALFNDAKHDMIVLIQKNQEEKEEAMDLLMVAKYFERIGDHATNIAEWVLYSMRTTQEEEVM